MFRSAGIKKYGKYLLAQHLGQEFRYQLTDGRLHDIVIIKTAGIFRHTLLRLLHHLCQVNGKIILTEQHLRTHRLEVMVNQFHMVNPLFHKLPHQLLCQSVRFDIRRLVRHHLKAALRHISHLPDGFLHLSPNGIYQNILLAQRLVVFQSPFQHLRHVRVECTTQGTVGRKRHDRYPRHGPFLGIGRLEGSIRTQKVRQNLIQLPLIRQHILNPPLHLVQLGRCHHLHSRCYLACTLDGADSIFYLFQ